MYLKLHYGSVKHKKIMKNFNLKKTIAWIKLASATFFVYRRFSSKSRWTFFFFETTLENFHRQFLIYCFCSCFLFFVIVNKVLQSFFGGLIHFQIICLDHLMIMNKKKLYLPCLPLAYSDIWSFRNFMNI